MHSFSRAIAHIDADCFFVSVEVAKNPMLKGKPVCVCTRLDGRGIVTSASYKARPFGIRAGTAVFQARERCPNAVFIQSNFNDYNLYASKIFSEIKNCSPDVEITSIDEAFVDLTGLRLLYRTSYQGIAEKIQKTIFQKFKIPVSIGISSTKLLAKLASDYAKPFGILAIPEKERSTFLKKIPIGDICGVGNNTEALLHKYGFKTAFDVSNTDKSILKKLLGVRGEAIYFELNGTALSGVKRADVLPKSISRTRTFPDFFSDRRQIFRFSLNLLVDLLARLRSYGLCAGNLRFFLLTKDFKEISKECDLPEKSAENKVFIKIFTEIFTEIFISKTVFRKVGFILSGLSEKDQIQPSLFQPDHQVRPFMESVDKINARFGPKSIIPASLLKTFNKKHI